MIKLHVTPAEGDGFEHSIEGDSVVIGRSTRCDLSISDRFLSRQHARLYRVDSDWIIEDLGSRNATFVNGNRISQPTPVRPGDVIAMSASLIRVVDEHATDSLPGSNAATPSHSDVLLRPASDVLLELRTPPPSITHGDGAIGRYTERLSILNEVHHALARSIELDDLLELILDRAFEHLQPQQGAVFLREPDGGFRRAAGRSLPGTGDLVYSESLVTEVADKEMAALVLDAQSDQRFAEAQSLLDAGVRSLVAAPLLDPKGALGLIVLSSNAMVRQFSEEDMELLVTLASVAAMRIRNIALAEEAAERRRLEHELTLARRIQVALLPESLPEIAGYQLYGDSIPSRVVSGDYWEAVERCDGGEWVFLVADVAGKGIAASLLTGYLEALCSTPIEAGLEPHEVFNQISKPFHRRTPSNRFATIILAVLEPETGTVRYANAGHVPACLVRAGGDVQWLGPTGMPLGLLIEAEYHSESAALGAGDTLVIFSDGFTEAERADEEQFGSDRLAEACVRASGKGAAEVAHDIEAELAEFVSGTPFVDDRTIVVIRREA